MTPISKTGLDYIERSPLDYWYHFLRPGHEEYVPDYKTVFDEALRLSVMDPKRFRDKFVATPKLDQRSPMAKAEIKLLTENMQAAKKYLLKPGDHEKIIAMRDVILSHPIASIILGSGVIGQPSMFADVNSGVQVKFRPHWIHGGKMIVHVMSTSNASAAEFSKEALNFKHHKRAAIQMDGLGIGLMVFLVIEKEPPYRLQIHHLDDRAITHGRSEYLKNCMTYAECLDTGKWPGLPEKILTVGLPEWGYK